MDYLVIFWLAQQFHKSQFGLQEHRDPNLLVHAFVFSTFSLAFHLLQIFFLLLYWSLLQ